MNKTTTSGKTANRLRAMIAAAIEQAAGSDRDAQAFAPTLSQDRRQD